MSELETDGGPCVRGPASGELGWALSVLRRAHARAADRALHDLPGGFRALRLMLVVDRGQPNQLALAEAAGLDRTVVTYLLDDLSRAGLVERQADPADRRAWRIVLTEAGAARLSEFTDRLEQVDEHLLAGLGATDATELRRLLRAAAAGVQEHGQTACC